MPPACLLWPAGARERGVVGSWEGLSAQRGPGNRPGAAPARRCRVKGRGGGCTWRLRSSAPWPRGTIREGGPDERGGGAALLPPQRTRTPLRVHPSRLEPWPVCARASVCAWRPRARAGICARRGGPAHRTPAPASSAGCVCSVPPGPPDGAERRRPWPHGPRPLPAGTVRCRKRHRAAQTAQGYSDRIKIVNGPPVFLTIRTRRCACVPWPQGGSRRRRRLVRNVWHSLQELRGGAQLRL